MDKNPNTPNESTVDPLVAIEQNEVTSRISEEPQSPPAMSSIYPTPGQLRPELANSQAVLAGKIAAPEATKNTVPATSVAGIVRIIVGIGTILSPIISIFITYWLMSAYYGGAYGSALSILGIKNFGDWVEFIWNSIMGGSYITALYGGGGITLTLIFFVLGVGILMKKEVARVALVGLMAIGIVTSLYAVATYTQQANAQSGSFSSEMSSGASAAQQADSQQRQVNTQAATQAAQEASKAYTQSQGTNSSLLTAKKKESPLIPYAIASVIIDILINAAVIVLLTRPAIRSQFS